VIAVAAEAGLPGCGTPGRIVSFEVAGQPMAALVAWDNTSPREQLLRR
jgi:hypothetical protein